MNSSVIRRLRDFVPIRALNRGEALRIGELQATRFLEAMGITEGPVPESAITELPRLQVARLRHLPVSAATSWATGRWQIILNASEPPTRQRFSLAHEFKHILDHRFIDHLYEGVPVSQRAAWIEQVCDYFAGCLLMPRPWVTQAFRSGVQEPAVLASRFGVSHAAMNYRLAQIGLVDPRSRCRLPDRSWRQVRTGQASDLRYQRPSHEGPATRSVQPWTQPKSTPRRPGSSALWPQ